MLILFVVPAYKEEGHIHRAITTNDFKAYYNSYGQRLYVNEVGDETISVEMDWK